MTGPKFVLDSRHVAVMNEVGEVSRETCERFAVYVDELIKWQQIKNLVSPHSLPDAWQRHVVDSAQLFFAQPDRKQWLDLGSGGGAPGVILGILLSNVGGHIHLVESNSRKCAFLRHAIRVTGASATVHMRRIEDCVQQFSGSVHCVTARALAAMPQLLEWTHGVIASGAVGLFPKGQDVDLELAAAAQSWQFNYRLIQSRTDADARIVVIESLEALAR